MIHCLQFTTILTAVFNTVPRERENRVPYISKISSLLMIGSG